VCVSAYREKEERSEVLKKEGVCELLMIYICVYV
jgi:hypothetical protein